jgi:hypothetical protein
MFNPDTETLKARTFSRGEASLPVGKQSGLYQCVVASASSQRRHLFERCAADAGWHTIVCGDGETALHCLNRMFVQLAIVDLEGQPRGVFRSVIEKAAATAGLLLVLCGNEGDLSEEIWARQLGAWLYLPGVAESSDVALLCGEALHIAERLGKVRERPHSGSFEKQRQGR